MKNFQKRIEDFVCCKCGVAVAGDGYTNHCPKCLWSKDVDINPGDRASKCGGMMRPIAVEIVSDGFVIIHKCEKCGKDKRNKSSPKDDFNAMLEIQKNMARQTTRSCK